MLRKPIPHFIVALAFAGVAWVAGSTVQSASFTVNTTAATVGGKSQEILVDSGGAALYYLTSDKPTVSACTGGCASVWPPLLTAAAPTAPASLPGKLAIARTANGSQVAYNRHLLYRYAPDTKPGQVNGEGLDGPGGGKWHVATPALKASAGVTNQSTGEYSDYH